jgi:tRNA 5-methylaminomethyl-2-thiouridine biosynthesis bifunctional protein
MSDDSDNDSGNDSPNGSRAGAQWREDGTLISGRFDDVYYSIEGGLDETRHVFLGGCGLPGGWQGRSRFTIAETGFGTGLNFLAAWQAFRAAPGACRCLHFLSVEGYPLTRSDMARAHASWPELAELSASLLAAYPPLEDGVHRLVFDEGRVVLTLLFGEAAAMFANIEARVDAWFLDGFSPARNPEMWREAVMDQVARLAAPQAVASSFTVARAVRDRLSERGFTVAKAPGFGRKRDMLVARKEPAGAVTSSDSGSGGPIAIIGGGIAGSAMAAALAARGEPVTLFEPQPDLSRAASGNPLGIVMPRLNLGDDPIASYNRAAWRFARAWYERLPADAEGVRPLEDCGVLQLARSGEESERLARLASLPNVACRSGTMLDAGQVRALTGIEGMEHGGLWLPEAGWVRPARLCHALLDHPLITANGTEILDLRRYNDRWQLLGGSGETVFEAETVIVANGLDSRRFGPLGWQPLRPKRGQITRLAVPEGEAGSGPGCIITFGHYLSPAVHGERVLGATYDHWPDEQPARWPEPEAASDAANLAALAAALPVLAARAGNTITGSRAALRATTPDHLPLVGPAPEPVDHNASLPGLYLLTGLGSTGLVMAPLAAEIITAELFDEPMPVESSLRRAVLPSRFLARAARRGELAGVAEE